MKASAKSVAAAAAQRQEAAKRSFEKSAKGSKPEGLSMSEAAETAGDRPQPSIFQVKAKATFSYDLSSFQLSKQTHCLIGLDLHTFCNLLLLSPFNHFLHVSLFPFIVFFPFLALLRIVEIFQSPKLFSFNLRCFSLHNFSCLQILNLSRER